MDKLTIATQVLLKLIETDKTGFDAEGIAAYSFEIADAMQAEAEKRNKAESAQKSKEIREILNDANTFDDIEEWQPDWSQAPRSAAAYMKLSAWDIGVWIDDLGFQINDAPTFAFTGSHIVERPHGF